MSSADFVNPLRRPSTPMPALLLLELALPVLRRRALASTPIPRRKGLTKSAENIYGCAASRCKGLTRS